MECEQLRHPVRVERGQGGRRVAARVGKGAVVVGDARPRPHRVVVVRVQQYGPSTFQDARVTVLDMGLSEHAGKVQQRQ